MNTTQQVLKEIGVEDIPIVTVFNKIDLLEENFFISKENNKISISAKTGYHKQELLEKIQSIVCKNRRVTMLIPYVDGSVLNDLHNKYRIEEEVYEEQGTKVVLSVDEADYHKYRDKIIQE